MTNDRLYAVYRGYCLAKNIEPVSKTTFVYKFLKVQNIHRSKDETLCQYCLELKNLEEKGELTQDEQKKKRENEEHKTKWYQQSSAYKNIKLKVSRGELMNEILVLHDFTQIKVQGTFFQDLIVCFYSYDANEKDGLKRDYYHYVGSSSYTKNDVSFVVAVWKEMLRKGLFKNCQKIYIFSDGGPKHFKITSTMSFFASFQKFSGIKILYNFFESNHGHSVCDAAASQAKKKLNEVQRNDEERISTPKRITEVINLIKNHGAEIVPESNIDLEKFSTFNGIRSYYKFTFSDDVVLGFVSTDSLNTAKFRKYIWDSLKRGEIEIKDLVWKSFLGTLSILFIIIDHFFQYFLLGVYTVFTFFKSINGNQIKYPITNLSRMSSLIEELLKNRENTKTKLSGAICH